MPPPSRQPVNHEVSVEELSGAGKCHRFNFAIDEEQVEDFKVILKRGTEEFQLGKPSRALYFGDRALYDQESERFRTGEKSRILNCADFNGNLRVFEELKRACQRGFVIPFVGAGMSKSAGCPEWKEYLLSLCRDAGLDEASMRNRIETQSDYEGAMNEIVARLTVNRFERDFERSFKTPDDIKGAVSLLPKLFDNSAITTNFDRVLETAYNKDNRDFVEKVSGRGQSTAFFRAIPAGERYLLKLHGNLDNAAERVLSKTEYDAAYGSNGCIDMNFPLPKLLKRLYSSYSFLFLGCSLSADRTIQTFIEVARLEGLANLPHHYAILASPSDLERKTEIDTRLADAHISPIWFPEGEFQLIEEILQLLID